MSRKAGKEENGERLTRLKRDRSRSMAEWITFSVSLAIVAGLAGLVIYLHWMEPDAPSVVEVRPQLEAVRAEAGGFYVPVVISNGGERAVSEVWVRLSLGAGGAEREFAQLSVPILEGGQTVQGVVVFRQDPAEGEITSTVSYTVP